MKRALLIVAGLVILGIPTLLMGRGPTRPGEGARSRTFKVATWNLRSGMGIQGSPASGWSHDALNCSDPGAPLNAWGIGLPQRELRQLAADSAIVALALQEAWSCAAPERVREETGFALATREQQGVALLARYGIRGEPTYHHIDAIEDRWLIGADVCLDAVCSVSVPIFSTHWGAPVGRFPQQAAAVVDALSSIDRPHVFMGDLNVFRRDRWNPVVRCTGRDTPGRITALDIVEAAGYQDVWKATQAGPGWTGMANRSDCGPLGGGLYKRIDYVFTRGLRPARSERFAVPRYGTDSASDHAGLIAELTLPAR